MKKTAGLLAVAAVSIGLAACGGTTITVTAPSLTATSSTTPAAAAATTQAKPTNPDGVRITSCFVGTDLQMSALVHFPRVTGNTVLSANIVYATPTGSTFGSGIATTQYGDNPAPASGVPEEGPFTCAITSVVDNHGASSDGQYDAERTIAGGGPVVPGSPTPQQ